VRWSVFRNVAARRSLNCYSRPVSKAFFTTSASPTAVESEQTSQIEKPSPEATEHDDFLDALPLLPKEQVPSLSEMWRPKVTWASYDDSKLVVQFKISELGLAEVEQQFFEALASPRVKEGWLKVVTRVEGGYAPHRAKTAEILDKLVEESKKLAVEYPQGPEE